MTIGAALGIDVGTTRVKASVVTLQGEELHTVSALTPWFNAPGGAQVDMTHLGDVAIETADGAAKWALDNGYVVTSIGITGMAETGALLGADDLPLAPGFAWFHTQGDPEKIISALGRDDFVRRSGRDCSISPSIIKLALLRDKGHEFRPGQVWLNVADYVAFRLCGVKAAEVSTSCRTGLLDITTGKWWDDALEYLGAGQWLLPGDPVPGAHYLGKVSAELPPSLQGAGVATAGHDHPVAALCLHDPDPGLLSLSLGTAEAQVRVVDKPLTPEQIARIVATGSTVDRHPLPGYFTILGAQATGITLQNLAHLLGYKSQQDRIALSRESLAYSGELGTAEIADVTFGSFSLKYIDESLSPAGLWKKANQSLIDSSQELTAAVGQVVDFPTNAVAFGGWIHDPLVVSLRKQASQGVYPLYFADVSEAGTVGAAMLAAVGCGEIQNLPHRAVFTEL